MSASNTDKEGFLSPTGVSHHASPCGNRSRKRLTRILSKVRFRDVDTSSEDENDNLSTWTGSKSLSPVGKGSTLRSGGSSGSLSGLFLMSSPTSDSRKKQSGADNRVRSPQSKQRCRHLRRRISSRRMSLGLLPPTLQSVREMSSASKSGRNSEYVYDRKNRSQEVKRSCSERYALPGLGNVMDEPKVRCSEKRKASKNLEEDWSSKPQKGSIEEIFRSSSNFSNSEADTISMKGFVQSLIALENEM
ncbi:hypothetical protein BWQ96_03452 [Gracilariopsis chorda]|uniref:Uncharacterized protein n=1 Tax=Gracilariopsis chorda TaxID=448386 RepID=A0A2V3IXC2_9FLOR|nr:hypothetical protein BWQ96_03452 [Gracilariopsis chorda]|eukprot:PXF46761.1 hypothetical protein BWQ96_03452 [Gracilariopsis chorda]